MIDPNFTYVKYNNFPDEIVKELLYIAHNNLDQNIFEIKENPWGFAERDPIQFEPDNVVHINGIDFTFVYLISLPNSGISYVHIDRTRDFGLNIPMQVDPIKGCTLVFEGEDYNRLGEYVTTPPWGGDRTPENSRRVGKYWLEAEEKEMVKVSLDKPMLLNTQRPHGWINNSEDARVIASLDPDPKIYSLDMVAEALTPFL